MLSTREGACAIILEYIFVLLCVLGLECLYGSTEASASARAFILFVLFVLFVLLAILESTLDEEELPTRMYLIINE